MVIGRVPLESPPQDIWALEFYPLPGFNLVAAAQNDDRMATYTVGLYLISPENLLSTCLSAGEEEVRGLAALPDGNVRLVRIAEDRLVAAEVSAEGVKRSFSSWPASIPPPRFLLRGTFLRRGIKTTLSA